MNQKIIMPNLWVLCLMLLCPSLARAHDTTRYRSLPPHGTISAGNPNSEGVNYRNFPSLTNFVTHQLTTQPNASDLKIQLRQDVTEFSDDYIRSIYTAPEAITAAKDTARNVFKILDQTQNFIDKLSPGSLVELPVGLNKRVGNTMVMIGISRAKYYKDYSELTVFCKVIIPQGTNLKDKELFFGADNVRFTHRGNLIGRPKLVLLGDMNIPINGGSTMLTLKGGMNMTTGAIDTSLTSVTFSCSGVESMSLTAEVSFSRALLTPLDANFAVITDPAVKVKGSFQTIVSDWNDLIASIRLPRFAIKGLEKIPMDVGRATFDFSDMRTPDNIAFPVAYQNMLPPNRALWRGVYLDSLKVYLPKEFKRKGVTERLHFRADSLLIDNLGMTGRLSANNVFQDGTASKWDFSVDKIEIEVLTNNLRSAGFSGSVALPVTKRPDTARFVSSYGLGYRAIFGIGGSYLMNVSLRDTVKFDVWGAKAKLLPSSFVELQGVDDKFQVKAVLHGNMGISTTTGSGKEESNFRGIEFNNLMLQTVSPRCSIGYMGYVSRRDTTNRANNQDTTSQDNRLVKFPVSLNTFRGRSDSNNVTIQVGFGVNLGDGTNRFSASSNLDIVGEVVESNERVSFRYKELKVNQIRVEANFNSFTLDGFVDINRDHPVMGTGFAGSINMKMTIASQPWNIQTKVAFGKTTYRYWYVDALASGFRMPVGGGVVITGFGGGAWQNMRSSTDPNFVRETVIPSGIGYTPDSRFRFGFRAMTQFAVGGKNAANGRLMLEMTFTESMGIQKVVFLGNMQALGKNLFSSTTSDILNKIKDTHKKMTYALGGDTTRVAAVGGQNTSILAQGTPNTSEPEEEEGSIRFKMGIEYNVSGRTFDANFSVALNLANGMIRGRQAEDVAGSGRLFISPTTWYLHLGKPSSPIGVVIGIPNVATVETSAYFMVGNELEAAPPVPSNVLNIIGSAAIQSLAANRNLSALSSGRGLALGASLNLDIPEIRFWPLYARFSAGIGFDVMISDYGNTTCVGSGRIGSNGWYTSGKAYSYLQGELGIDVSIWAYRGRLPIISAGAATLLQAQLPNPTWFSGYLAGYYRLLGGIVRGSFNFNVNFGNRCTIQNENMEPNPMEFITDMIPETGGEEIDVLAVPQAVFRMPLEESYTLELRLGEPKTYRAVLQSFDLTTSDGTTLAGQLRYSIDKKSVFMETADAMPSNAAIIGKVIVKFEEQKENRWLPTGLTEEREIVFRTGSAPNKIPLTNLAYTYPVVNQKYFFVGENNEGVIRLKRNLPNIITPTTQLSVTFLGSGENQIHSAPATYDFTKKTINFTIPQLNTNSTYLVNVYADNSAGELGGELNYENVVAESEEKAYMGSTMITDKNKAASLLVRSLASGMRIPLTFTFSTSVHNTFIEKMVQKDIVEPNNIDMGSGIFLLGGNNSHSSEPFDEVELIGTQYSGFKPLMEAQNTLDEDYNTNIIQLIFGREGEYQEYDPTHLYTAIELSSDYRDRLHGNNTEEYLRSVFPYRYSTHYEIMQNFYTIRDETLNNFHNTWCSQMSPDTWVCQDAPPRFLAELQAHYGSVSVPCPIPDDGFYNTKFSYKRPDGVETSNHIFKFIR
jgi:hypothetical protein